MKKLIANFLIVLTLLTALSGFTFANSRPAAFNNQIALTKTNSATDSFSDLFRAQAYDTNFHLVYVEAGDTLYIDIEGDGYTNLDLWVFGGSSSTPLRRKTGATDKEYTQLYVKQSGYLRIYVVNRGNDYNDYSLTMEVY